MSTFDFSHATRIGNPKMLLASWGYGASTQIGTANRVFLCSLWVPKNCVIDEINIQCSTASAGKSFRIGLYGPDTSNTPADLPLLTESGNIAAAVGVIRYTATLSLQRGLYWLALSTEDATMAFLRQGSYTFFTAGIAPMLEGCYYGLGGWGAFTNPCPAVTILSAARVACAIHIQSWNEL